MSNAKVCPEPHCQACVNGRIDAEIALARERAMRAELLAALRELVDYRDRATLARPQRRDGTDGRYARARAAIKNAEGQP